MSDTPLPSRVDGNWLTPASQVSSEGREPTLSKHQRGARSVIDPNGFLSPVKWIQESLRAQRRHADTRTHPDDSVNVKLTQTIPSQLENLVQL